MQGVLRRRPCLAPAGDRPLVKVCGVTRERDVELLDGMVEYIGFIHGPVSSPRALPLQRIHDLASTVSRSTPVLVAAGLPASRALEAAAAAGIEVVQLHTPLAGEELEAAAGLAAAMGLRIAPVLIRARGGWRSATPREAGEALEDRVPVTEYVLVDADKRDPPGGPGGLRISLDAVAEAVAALAPRGLLVAAAGGVRPGNACLLAGLGVGMIDVSSGVEEAPGAKDIGLVEVLLRELEGCAPRRRAAR